MTRVIGIERDGARTGVATLAEGELTISDVLPDDFGEAVVVTAIDSADVLVRQLKLEVTKEKEIAQVLPFQLEPLLPFALDEVVYNYQVLEDGRVVVVAVPKVRLKSHIEAFNEQGIEPEVISCVPVALARLFKSDQVEGILHMNERGATCVVAHKGFVLASRALRKGADTSREIARTFTAMSSRKGQEVELEQIIVCGAVPTGFALSELDIPCEIVDRPNAVAEGLACAANVVDFRQGEFSYPRRWRRLKKQVFALATLGILLAVSTFALGQALINDRAQAIRWEYAQLAHCAGQANEEILAIDQMLINARLLGQELTAIPETFPLAHKLPRVADMLAYLTSHPTVMGGSGPLIEVQSLHYAMVRYPTQKRPNDHYQVRFDLEFTAQNPTVAREFHDSLLLGNRMIDPASEIQWTAGKDLYVVSFYLRDRTRYPAEEVG